MSKSCQILQRQFFQTFPLSINFDTDEHRNCYLAIPAIKLSVPVSCNTDSLQFLLHYKSNHQFKQFWPIYQCTILTLNKGLTPYIGYSIWYRTLCKWPSGAQVEKFLLNLSQPSLLACSRIMLNEVKSQSCYTVGVFFINFWTRRNWDRKLYLQNTQHSQQTDMHPHTRDSNPQFQQASGRRHTL